MAIPAAGQDIAVAGVDSYTLYGAETTYATAAGSINKHFGIVTRVSPTKRNNLLQVRGFKGTTTGGRQMVKSRGGKFEPGVSVEFEPQTWEWLEYVMGTKTGSGTSGDPYIYTKSSSPGSLSIATSIELGSTDQDVIYLGCLVNSCTLRAAMGEKVTCTLELVAADLDKDNTVQTPVALSSLDVFVFSGVTLQWPSGEDVNHVIDSIEITITNNAEVRYGLGSRTGKKGVHKQLEYQIRFTVDLEDDTFLDDFLGSASGPATDPTRVATAVITFTNSATHSCTFTFTGVTVDEDGGDQTYAEVIPEDITAIAESLSVSEVQSA